MILDDPEKKRGQGYVMYKDHAKCPSAGQTSVVLNAFLCSQVCDMGLGTRL